MERQSFRIAIIPGDGIGREVVPAARRVLDALNVPFTYVELNAGWETFQRTGTALPAATLSALRACEGAIFGAVSSPSQRVEGYSSPIIAMRKALGLYANLRPVVSAPVAGSQPGIDMLIVRENTECLYVKQERLEDEGNTAVAQRVITRLASTRIGRMAFEQASLRASGADSTDHAPLVTIVHKANVLSLTDGLFRESVLDVARDYPQIAVEEQLVDSMIYRLIREPQRYDVVVAPNLYGDIISDAAAALVGGLGVAPSANVGDAFVLVEPVHGSAPDIAGRGIANPTATILAGALLLRALRLEDGATAIEGAVNRVLSAGVWTPDLGGAATTEQVTNAVIEQLAVKAL
jgi:homoisocitrate dehydrogenase